MFDPLIFSEASFSKFDTRACAGLTSTELQEFIENGLLDAGPVEEPKLAPRHLAAIRLMLAMAKMGIPLLQSAPLAARGAASVVWLALVEQPHCWTVAGPSERAQTYRTALDRRGDAHLRQLSGVSEETFRYGVFDGENFEFVSTIDDDCTDHQPEVSGLLRLTAVAERLARSVSRPLFTVAGPGARWASA